MPTGDWSYPDALGLPEAAPDVSPYHICRFNVDWLAYVLGALERLKKRDIWDGTEEEIDTVLSQIDEAINQIATEYEPPTGAMDTILLQEQRASGTHGGGFTAGAWYPRELNTEVVDTGGYASLSSSQVTLEAGTYWFEGWAIGYSVGAHKLRLQNVSDATTIAVGSTERAVADVSSKAVIRGRFTIDAQKTFELQHRCGKSYGSYGRGYASSLGTEIYSEISFHRE